MSKAAVAALVIGSLGVGAVILIASTSKASTPPASPFQFGQGQSVQGLSGAVWMIARVLNPGPVAPGANVFAVFPMNVSNDDGTRKTGGSAGGGLVMFYAQQGDDKSSRAFVSSPRLAGDGTLERARQDFGV